MKKKQQTMSKPSGSRTIFLTRKSLQAVIPQMPTKRLQTPQLQLLRNQHRTQHKSIDCPESQLDSYKRKDFKALQQLSSPNSKLGKDRQQTLPTQRSIYQKLFPKQLNDTMKANQKYDRDVSVSSFNKDLLTVKKQSDLNNNNYSGKSSRFAQDHHNTDSIINLINHSKSKDSNPLINTARMEDSAKNNSSIAEGQKVKTIDSLDLSNKKYNAQINGKDQDRNTVKIMDHRRNSSLEDQDSSKINQPVQQDENDNDNQNEEENFDDYMFGGAEGSNPTIGDITTGRTAHISKAKRKKMMPPPKVQSYSAAKLLQKPSNWRQMNRYIPKLQEQHRMGLQHIGKEKQKLQLKREQQQISKLIQEYQLNKKVLNNQTKRKIQTNKIMEKMYKQKRMNRLGSLNSASLPQLKTAYQKAKLQFDISQMKNTQQDLDQSRSIEERIQDKISIKNVLSKNPTQQKFSSLNRYVKQSLSFSKLAFGCQQPRRLYQNQLHENQIQNVQKLQKKLRQKGVSFNAAAMRKGLINYRQTPIYKISEKGGKRKNTNPEEQIQNKLDIPEKQLPSNAFYKVYPL